MPGSADVTLAASAPPPSVAGRVAAPPPAEAECLLDYWGRPRPVAHAGEGAWITGTDGRRYLDAVGGLHVVSIGHGNRDVAQAIGEQAGELSFPGRPFVSEPQLELAAHIAKLAPGGLRRCHFASTGAEAVEMAMQIAWHWQALRGQPQRTKLIGQRRSYHGGTLAAVSLGGHPGHRGRLQANLLPFLQAPATPAYGADPARFAQDLDDLICREGPDTVCAFVAEPITGSTSGAIVPPAGWHEAIRAVCDAHGVLFIVDEVTTGFGRTGRNFAIQHWAAVPDIIVGSKGLSSGYAPLSVAIVHDRIADGVQAAAGRIPLRSTFAGNPLACAAGLAVQRYIEQHHLVDRCRRMGAHLHTLLSDFAQATPCAGTPRGIGLLRALPLWRDPGARIPFARSEHVQERVVAAALQRGLMIMGGAGSDDSGDGDFLYLTPPFVISPDECAILVDRLAAAVADVLGPGLAG